MTGWEEQIGEYAQGIMTLVESEDGPAVTAFLSKLAPEEHLAVTVAIAKGLLEQEAANDALAGRNAVLEGGNIALFRERRELTEKVAELRSILDARAGTAKSGRRSA